MKILYLVDAYALIYKCYYAFMSRPMRSPDGVNTSAIFGFTKYIRDIIRNDKPHYLGVAFDSKGPTFRHEMYSEYKANRQAAPEDIHLSVPYIKKFLEAMRIPILEMQGYEADDIIGTLSCKASKEGFRVYMVTPDKDFGQLVDDSVFIYKQRKGGEGVEIVDREKIKAQYGIDDPRQLIDILALWGDASDNIPGVPGIGEKSAIKLVCEYGTVENLLDNIDDLKGKQKDNILAYRADLEMSKELATINTDVPVEFNPEKLILEDPDAENLRNVFRELGFNMFLREMENGIFLPELKAPDLPRSVQNDLFSAVDTPSAAPSPMTVTEPPVPEISSAVQGDLFSSAEYKDINNSGCDYSIVVNTEMLENFRKEVYTTGSMSIVTVTSGPDIFNDRILGIAMSVRPGCGLYVPMDGEFRKTFVEIFAHVLGDGNISKAGHNIKTDIMVLEAGLGIRTRGMRYDVMILHYLLDPESNHGLGFLARNYLRYDPIEMETLVGKGVRRAETSSVPVGKMADFAAEDADLILQLKDILWEQVLSLKLDDLYANIEEPMIEVLAAMETTGVRIDTGALHEYGKQLTLEMEELEKQVREITGEPGLNVNSAKQLGEALFGKMKIEPKPKLTKTKQYRTDEEYLMSILDKSPVIDIVLKYRGLKKLLSTYIEALPQLVNRKTGRLHTSFNQAVTATGRLSSSNPNLQNIPIRNEQGREIRRSFIAEDGYVLLSADYSQVELRLMADLSGDKGLIEAFRNKEDIHTSTAARIFGIPLPEVTSEQRRRAKTANFGIIYGISAFGLSQRLTIPRSEAKEIIDGYFRSYPGVKAYMDSVIEQARVDGYVTTIFGRKRFLPDIRSANAVTRGLAERNAINAPLQGSAADIIKIAMVKIYAGLKEMGLESRMILQVHDELVLEVRKQEQEKVTELVVTSMENAARLAVDLSVDYGIGLNWLVAH